MCSRTLVAGSLVALVTLAGPPPSRAADVDTSPARASVFETRHLVSALDSVSVDAQTLKGKPKQVLTITASATVVLQNSNAAIPYLTPTLNGQFLDPPNVLTDCPTFGRCSVTGQWIVDLDQAELADPGTIVGQPLNVHVSLSDVYQNLCSAVDVNVAVRMEKKK